MRKTNKWANILFLQPHGWESGLGDLGSSSCSQDWFSLVWLSFILWYFLCKEGAVLAEPETCLLLCESPAE